MAIRDILVHVEPDAASPAEAYAVSLAAAFRAHIQGLAFGFWPAPTSFMLGEYPAAYFEELRTKEEDAGKAAAARFDEVIRKEGLSGTAHFVTTDLTAAADMFAERARLADLSVLAQDQPDGPAIRAMIIEAALFDTGRPVVIVPYVHRSAFRTERVVVAWDGGAQATRAVHDALPILQQAGSVEVVAVETDQRRGGNELLRADIAAHLARHDLKVSLKWIPGRDIEVADALLNHVADQETDLLVMGGFGHSRFREFVLGGATRGVLEAMTIPVFMAH
jgi:nucleotide-binding universal stress UspA family protein